MKRILVGIFLIFSISILAQAKLNVIGFYSPYEVSYTGWNSTISFNDDQYRTYEFALSEPPLFLASTHSLAFGLTSSVGILKMSYWLDMAMLLGGGRNEIRIGTSKSNFESGYTLRILSYHYHDVLADPLSSVPYAVTFKEKIFDPTETQVSFFHGIYNFRSGFYSTFYLENIWLSVAYYPGILNFTLDKAGVKISDNNHTVFFPMNPDGDYNLSNDKFSVSLGFSFRIF